MKTLLQREASEWAGLAPIRKLLEDRRFKVETPGLL
jgi:hypothetical protein